MGTPRTVPVRVTNLAKTGLIIYGQGKEDLIFNVSFTLEAIKQTKREPKPDEENKPESAVKAVETESTKQTGDAEATEKPRPEAKPAEPEIKQLAWVIPVPIVPTGYGQADALCFQELDDLLPIYRYDKTSGGFGGGNSGEQKPERSLLVYPSYLSGDYQIQPLRALGTEGVQALKDWLTQNDFTPMSERALSYYAANNWTFLAIKVKVKGLSAGKSHALNPLRISFPTNRLVFPMKMAEGKISATLFVLSEVQLPGPGQALSNFGFEFQGAKVLTRESLRQKKLLQMWGQSALRTSPRAYLYRFQAANITPSSFPTEIIFP